MNGNCYPVSDSIADMASKGGYLSIAGGTALKNLLNTSQTVSNFTYSKTFTTPTMMYRNGYYSTVNVAVSGHTPRGALNVTRTANHDDEIGSHTNPISCITNGNDVIIRRYRPHYEDEEIGLGEVTWTEIYW